MLEKFFVWQLYVMTYSLFLGLPLLLFPNALLQMIGFNTTDEPWVRVVGGMLLALPYITFTIYRKRIKEMILPTIAVRSGLVVVLVTLGFTGGYPAFYVIAEIVLVGVIGTVASLRLDRE